MRRFATWITGHRKTVIIGWIVALIGVGMLAGSAGSDFSEEFKLPASDSQEAFDLLETKFPAQSGDTATIVYKADGGVESAAVKKTMEGVFAKVASCRTSAKSPAPTAGRHRRGQRRRQDRLRDGPVRRHHQQTRKGRPQEAALDQPGRHRQRPPGRARRPADRGSPRRRRRRRLLLHRAAGGGRDPADHLRLGRGDGAADRSPPCSRSASASAWSRSAPTSSTPPSSPRSWR